MDATNTTDPAAAVATNFLVWDLQSGAGQAASGADALGPPASVTKLFSALAVLDEYGPDYRFATKVLRSGDVEGRALQGDLVPQGAGDPGLGTDDLAELAAAVRRRASTRPPATSCSTPTVASRDT